MGTEPDSGFGSRLRRLRERAGLSQEELAEKAGLTANGIGALERGDRKHPYPSTVQVLADALGLVGRERVEFVASVPRRQRGAAPKPSTVRASTLPAPPTLLVGRGREVGEVASLLGRGGVRLLTLTGPGGVGKTRLAMEVANQVVPLFPDGVVFVPLAPLEDSALLFDTMGHSLGVREAPGQSTREALLASLTGKRMLIVLDNCEHLLEGVGDISRLLSSSPELMLLATSRAPLRLQGEQEYPLSPLPVPEMAYLPSVTDVEEVPSVQLFVDRAQAASPVFTLNQSNAAAVATICRRLDGLPLAIELAAPRTKMLSPTALLSRLDKSLPLLTGGSRDLPDRQRTMEAAIRWSYELLSPEEQALFRQLSIFAGGWTLEAAEAVGAMEDVLSPLERLVEQSLVVVAQGEDVRYRMLEPIRQYARRCLDEAQETKGTELQHSRYYTAFGEDAAQELGGASQAHWLQILETEHDNLRSTLSRLLEDGEQVEAALRLTGALWLFWHTRGYLREGRRWIESALAAAPEADARLRGRALLGAAWMAIFQGDYEAAKSQIEEALALYRSRGDAEGIASALTHLGFTAILGQRQDIPVEAALAEALELRPQLKDPRVLGNLLVFSGLVTLVAGDIPGAIQPHEEALALFREVRDTWGMKTCLTNLGLIALIRRDLASASAFLRENLELSWQTDYKLTTQYSLLGLAGVSSLVGQPTRSARLWGAAEVVREAAGIEIPPLGRAATNYDGLVACARQELGAGEFEAAWAEGRAMTARQAMEYAASED